MEQLLQVGVISSTHGIRGEVKVFPTTDDPDRFRKLKQVILDTGREQFRGGGFHRRVVFADSPDPGYRCSARYRAGCLHC